MRLRGRKTTASARPAGSQAGTASARTPLLPVALSGPVFLATRSDGSPGLAVRLGGIITLSLDGTLDIGAAGVSTTFDGIPDVPLERFELSLAGGPHGALAVGTDLCRGRPPAVSAAFTAHSGAATADARAATVAGCSRRPLTSVSIRDQASGRPSLRLIVQRSRAGAPLTSCGWACRRRCG